MRRNAPEPMIGFWKTEFDRSVPALGRIPCTRAVLLRDFLETAPGREADAFRDIYAASVARKAVNPVSEEFWRLRADRYPLVWRYKPLKIKHAIAARAAKADCDGADVQLAVIPIGCDNTGRFSAVQMLYDMGLLEWDLIAEADVDTSIALLLEIIQADMASARFDGRGGRS